MRIESEATIEDLRHVLDDGKAELVNGELVVTSPAGGLHNYAAHQIAMSLHAHCRRQLRFYCRSSAPQIVQPRRGLSQGPINARLCAGRAFVCGGSSQPR